MSYPDLGFDDDTDDEPTKGQLMEMCRGMQARIKKLEEENEELREQIETVDKNNVSRPILNQLLAALVNDRESVDFTADPVANKHVIEDFGLRVESIEVTTKELQSKVDEVYDGSVDGPRQAWMAIVDAANRLKTNREHGLPGNRVKLWKENIAQATGKSEKQAGNYIDRFGDGKQGTDKQPYQRASAANNNETQKKALIIDLDVWGDDDD